MCRRAMSSWWESAREREQNEERKGNRLVLQKWNLYQDNFTYYVTKKFKKFDEIMVFSSCIDDTDSCTMEIQPQPGIDDDDVDYDDNVNLNLTIIPSAYTTFLTRE